MQIIDIIVQYVLWVLLGVLLFFCGYQIIISLFGLYRKKEPKRIMDRDHMFAAVISARNEEKVIGYLIDSLMNQDYPKDKFDVVVVADNCTDSTAEVARQHGAIVYERFNDVEKGKGFALKYILDILMNDKEKNYDAFCVFDADNLVHKDFLKVMNDKLCCGFEICQGYRDMKNPSDTWITGNYSLFYWTQSRFYNQARYNLGLSSQINGTGYMVKFDVIRDTGWCTRSVTEDIEFTFTSIANGRYIAFARDAIIYDEQPLKFKASWRQRVRWSTGYIQCMGLCMKNLLKNGFKRRDIKALDGSVYFFGLPIIFVGGVVFGILMYLAMTAQASQTTAYFMIRFSVMMYILPVMLAIFVVLLEDKKISSVWKGILTYPIFNFTWLILNIYCVFKKRSFEWHPVDHVVGISLEDMKGKKDK